MIFFVFDKDYQGLYGQVLNSEIVRSFFRGKTLPRIIVLNPTRLKEDLELKLILRIILRINQN